MQTCKPASAEWKGSRGSDVMCACQWASDLSQCHSNPQGHWLSVLNSQLTWGIQRTRVSFSNWIRIRFDVFIPSGPASASQPASHTGVREVCKHIPAWKEQGETPAKLAALLWKVTGWERDGSLLSELKTEN